VRVGAAIVALLVGWGLSGVSGGATLVNFERYLEDEQSGAIREVTWTLIPWSPQLWDIDHDGLLELLIPCGDDEGFTMMPNRGNSIPLLYAGAAVAGGAGQLYWNDASGFRETRSVGASGALSGLRSPYSCARTVRETPRRPRGG
jgi:hypothetical protein